MFADRKTPAALSRAAAAGGAHITSSAATSSTQLRMSSRSRRASAGSCAATDCGHVVGRDGTFQPVSTSDAMAPQHAAATESTTLSISDTIELLQEKTMRSAVGCCTARSAGSD